MQQPSTFQVYNASAGSGKTFTLVKEYLKILLQSEDLFRFQKILAITFTNKAAGEMKERVLENLKAFSEGEETDLYAKIIEETSLDATVVVDRSKIVLDAILKNYSAFSITTIDSFTHKIIKGFAFDLGLSLNFEVEMDPTSLLNEAVDVLISKIGIDKKLTETLVDFSLDKADDDKSWDIARELNEFSRILLNEDDTKHFRNLADKSLEDFTNLKKRLSKHQQELKVSFQKVGEACLQLISNSDLEAKDFTRSTIPNFFKDVAEKNFNFSFTSRSQTIQKAIDNNQYYNKSTSEDKVAVIEGIVPQIVNFFNQLKELYQQYVLNKLALKSIIPLAVLNHIHNELIAIKSDNNLLLNAELNQLISDHIKDQPAPFIYERLGQRFMHYFIDEMQDTSVLQWKNLIPLIDNALAQENSNLLLVGDGKQAIYRWRGGKAEQFIDLGSEGENSVNPFFQPKETKTLETNYRSYTEVIDFNNNFFQHTASFLQNESYNRLFLEGNKQLENTKKGGFVTLTFLEKEVEKEAEKLKYPQKVLERINVLRSEFQLNEICVLARKKKDGIAVASFLSENGIEVISPDSLLLENSQKVVFLINVLRVVQHPNDEETRFEMLYFLYKHLSVSITKDAFLHQYVKKDIVQIFKELQEYGVSFDLNEFQQIPFYEKVETIIRSFNLITSSDAYVQFFLDVVLERQRKGTSVQEFLDFWEDKKQSLSIVASDNSDAVQVMTIHKSKGLEFPVVIFPYDLDIYRQINPKIWLNDLPSSFDGFKELLVPYTSDLQYINTRGAEIYQQQREELELDNFNLLYVALTRAVEQLHIITEKKLQGKEKQENHGFYSGVFINFLKKHQLWQDDVLEYTFGDSVRVSESKNLESITEMQETFISSPWKDHNIVMLASASKLWNTEQGKAIDFGNLIHEMMSKIITNKDVKNVVHQYGNQGEFPLEKSESIKESIYKIVNHHQLKTYFSEEVTVFNEREIITMDGQIIIPDRLVFNNRNEVVIIDYKTGKASKSYHQQLLKYEQVLKSMSFQVGKKLLIYLNEEIDVVEV